jgi:hypothetical protein
MPNKKLRPLVIDLSRNASAPPAAIQPSDTLERAVENTRLLEPAALAAMRIPDALERAIESQQTLQRATESQRLVGPILGPSLPASGFSDSFMEEIQRGAALRASIEAAHAAADREKRERQQRETASLNALEGIRAQLEGLGRVIAEHDQVLKRHDEELVRIRSGASGRPSAMHLVRIEFDRRVAMGQLEATVTAMSEALEAWVHTSYPDAAPLKAKTIRNILGVTYREAKARLRSAPVPHDHQRRP